jgi:hypothetical protein
MSEIRTERKFMDSHFTINHVPRLIRHFNYSIQEDNAYRVETIKRDSSPGLMAKARYIKQMYSRAHGIQIGHLRIYFSGNMPVGLYHPETGPLCLDNLWDRLTAYCLNRVNRNDDKRMSIEHFHNILNKYLKIETSRDIKLYIPNIDNYGLREQMKDSPHFTKFIW